MIIASIRFSFSAQERDKIRDVLLSVLGPTRAMSGCISCRLYQESNGHNSLLLLEEWISDKDLIRHITSNNYKRVLETMELVNKEPEVKFVQVLKTEGFDFIKDIRS